MMCSPLTTDKLAMQLHPIQVNMNLKTSLCRTDLFPWAQSTNVFGNAVVILDDEFSSQWGLTL